jgi:hypothetical protein
MPARDRIALQCFFSYIFSENMTKKASAANLFWPRFPLRVPLLQLGQAIPA